MLLALVDCNNFFVSCERLFNPKLLKKPVVVLSSNDGCVIARSQEAKALGIPMGAPAFLYKTLFSNHGVTVLSSNFSLYLDMSHRVMKTLTMLTKTVDVYSIDEAFIEIDSEQQAYEIRKTIYSWTGIPVSIGIAATKTLAKVANSIAKKSQRGIFLIDESNRVTLLEKMAVEDIWGIGRKLSLRLRKKCIFSAYELTQQSDLWLKKTLTVVGHKIALELRGVPALALSDEKPLKKSISSCKSFATPLKKLSELEEVLAGYTARLSKELRDEKQKAGCMTVFLPDVCKEAHVGFTHPTSYTPELITCAKKLLRRIFTEGMSYKKVGVLFTALVPESREQEMLFSTKSVEQEKKEHAVMQVYDRINERFGKKSIFFLAAKDREVRCEKRTSRYTTRWDELLRIT